MKKKEVVPAALMPARIKASRMRAGLSQVQLATQLGVTAVMLNHYELGRASPPKKGGKLRALLDFIELWPPPA
tara:strand:- start:626 stop:844 length:219 start_codon:yes stop_codon:yes gene_type:complete